MTRVQAAMAAILGTLAEIPQGGPASAMYLAIGADLPFWEQVNRIGQNAGLWTCSPAHWVQATPKGIDLGTKINEATAAELAAGKAGGAA